MNAKWSKTSETMKNVFKAKWWGKNLLGIQTKGEIKQIFAFRSEKVVFGSFRNAKKTTI